LIQDLRTQHPITSKVRQYVKPRRSALICKFCSEAASFAYGKSNNVKASRSARCLCLWLAAFSVTAMTRASDADLVLTNGNIYTVNEKQPTAEAIVVKGDRIVFVGSGEEAKKFHAAKVVDLHGRTVVPGLTDSHCHIFGIGEREMRLNLEGTKTLDDFLGKVKARVAQTPTGKWITGRGWIETFWKPPKFPTHQDLDKIAPDNPVFLTRADGHAAVANSAALRIPKIDRNTPDPFGGQILKTNGEPNGMLLDNAQELVSRNIPKPTEAEREKALLHGIDREIGLGWCEIQNAGSHREDIGLIRKDFEAGKIKIRLH
jgi:predicted amidohydrolase YtcJ